MLYMIGPVAIDVFPYNVNEVSRERETDYAEKSVLGRLPPNEWVGEKSDQITLSGQLLPERLPGGMETHDVLHRMREAGEAQMVMRGDGALLGWFVISKASEKETFLGLNGVGRVAEISITLKRDGPPSAGGFMGGFSSLFG